MKKIIPSHISIKIQNKRILEHFLEHKVQNKTNYEKRQKLRVQSCYWKRSNYRLIRKNNNQCAANSINSVYIEGLKCLSPNQTRHALQFLKDLSSTMKKKWFDVCPLHQHFVSNFSVNYLVPKSFKTKLQAQTLTFVCKNKSVFVFLLVKCLVKFDTLS